MNDDHRLAIDFIGDIHGNYTKLISLLQCLGYCWDESKNCYFHPEGRKILILGDFINVGLNNLKVLELLYSMHKQQQEFIIAGNHEYFIALLYHKFNQNKNAFWYYIQTNYYPLFQEFTSNRELFYHYLNWIFTLPLFIEFGDVKAVHALWDDYSINKIRPHNNVLDLIQQSKENATLRENVNKSLIGITHKYRPEGKDRTIFFRYRWWDYEKNLPIQNMFIHKSERLPLEEIQNIDLNQTNIAVDNYTIFFGHYNLQGYPYLTHPKRCCLDFGGAKGGFLAAYRWNGETELNEANLYWV